MKKRYIVIAAILVLLIALPVFAAYKNVKLKFSPDNLFDAFSSVVTDLGTLQTEANLRQNAAGNFLMGAEGTSTTGIWSTISWTAVKLMQPVYVMVNKKPIKLASQDLPNPATVVTAGTYDPACWEVNSVGTISVVSGTAAATLPAVTMPTLTANKALLGCAFLWNTTGGDLGWGTAFATNFVALGSLNSGVQRWNWSTTALSTTSD